MSARAQEGRPAPDISPTVFLPGDKPRDPFAGRARVLDALAQRADAFAPPEQDERRKKKAARAAERRLPAEGLAMLAAPIGAVPMLEGGREGERAAYVAPAPQPAADGKAAEPERPASPVPQWLRPENDFRAAEQGIVRPLEGAARYGAPAQSGKADLARYNPALPQVAAVVNGGSPLARNGGGAHPFAKYSAKDEAHARDLQR